MEIWSWQWKGGRERDCKSFSMGLSQHTHSWNYHATQGQSVKISSLTFRKLRQPCIATQKNNSPRFHFPIERKYHNMVLNTIIIMLPQDDNSKSHGNLPLIHETPIMINVNTWDDLTMNCTQTFTQRIHSKPSRGQCLLVSNHSVSYICWEQFLVFRSLYNMGEIGMREWKIEWEGEWEK